MKSVFDLLFEEDLDDGARSLAQTIHDSSVTMVRLIDELLEFGHLESRTIELQEVPFDLHQWLESTVLPFRAHARAQGLELVGRRDPSSPRWLLGDPDRLRQVATNLLHNALKFTEHGKVVVSLSHDGEQLHLSVSDTGLGISPDKIDHIFEPFLQLESTRTRRRGGVGLGLSISEKIVARMNGRI